MRKDNTGRKVAHHEELGPARDNGKTEEFVFCHILLFLALEVV